MSTIDRPNHRTVPPLVAGQRLDRATFHERYEAMPPETRAELIGGVVYMPSPTYDAHGEMSLIVSFWLGFYIRSTPGIRGGGNVSTLLDELGEPQPDAVLRYPEKLEGQTRVVKGYITGAPELVIEIARATRRIDLGGKKKDYERAGVAEYVVVALEPDEIYWHRRTGTKFPRVAAGKDGVYRSERFPGLWLDPAALYSEDWHRLTEVLERGLATPEHASFVRRLEQALKKES